MTFSYLFQFLKVKELLTTNTVDMLIIAETKLGNTFINSQFAVDNYHLWRAGRNSRQRDIIKSGVFDSQSLVVLLFVSKYESVKFGRIQFLQINYRLILKGCCTCLQSSRYTLYTSAVNIEFETDVNNDIFTELKEVRKRHPNQLSCVYLNINSFGY
jgi:hypothetical protein